VVTGVAHRFLREHRHELGSRHEIAIAGLCHLFGFHVSSLFDLDGIGHSAADSQHQLAICCGEVQGTHVKVSSDRDNKNLYYGRVAYRYLVEGKEYTSDLTDLGPGTKRSRQEEARADVAEFTPGMKVAVYYDPGEPSVAVIRTGMPTIRLLLLVGLAIGTIIGAFVSFFTVRGWLRALRTRQDETLLEKRTDECDEARPPTQDAELGVPREVFRPALGNILAGFIISALLVGGGAAAIGFPLHAAQTANWNLPFDTKIGWTWLAVGLVSAIGVGLIIGGVLLARYVRGLIPIWVETYTQGFRYHARQTTENVLWVDIIRITETILHQRPPILKFPARLLIPKVASHSYTVATKFGKEYSFDGNSIKRITRLGDVLRAQARRLSLRWETV
jgi:hypothetical protein